MAAYRFYYTWAHFCFFINIFFYFILKFCFIMLFVIYLLVEMVVKLFLDNRVCNQQELNNCNMQSRWSKLSSPNYLKHIIIDMSTTQRLKSKNKLFTAIVVGRSWCGAALNVSHMEEENWLHGIFGLMMSLWLSIFQWRWCIATNLKELHI